MLYCIYIVGFRILSVPLLCCVVGTILEIGSVISFCRNDKNDDPVCVSQNSVEVWSLNDFFTCIDIRIPNVRHRTCPDLESLLFLLLITFKCMFNFEVWTKRRCLRLWFSGSWKKSFYLMHTVFFLDSWIHGIMELETRN